MKTKGFTLLELLVTVAIIGVLMLFAAPSYKRFLENQKVRSVLNQWQNSFYFAQREAMRLKQPIYFCGSSNGTSCDKKSDFSEGWIVVSGNPNKGGTILQDVARPDPLLQLNLSGNAFRSNGMMFRSTGRANANGTLSVCLLTPDEAKASSQPACNQQRAYNQRVYVVSAGGRLIGKDTK